LQEVCQLARATRQKQLCVVEWGTAATARSSESSVLGRPKVRGERCNTIVMDPSQGFLRSLQQLAAGLMRGNNLMVFPEGTRSLTGELGPFKDSYAILARELDIPVVPVVIDGAHAVLPRGRRLPNLFCPITVTYLSALRPLGNETAADFNRRVI
jgi:1-acyl-sn-glycerol-3-phosphate acyltransferase